jgi:8-oxo-dGTP diphosphatase
MSQGAEAAKPLLIVAAGALVDAERRVLIAQRPAHKSMGGLWEFPGGKVEAGESPEAALARELKEELDVDIAALSPLTFASHDYGAFHLLMPLFLVSLWRGRPRALEAQALAWVAPQRLGDYAMPPADGPLIEALQQWRRP